jgi:hypothetical protein
LRVSLPLKYLIALALSLGFIYALLSPLPALSSAYSDQSLHNGLMLVILAGAVWLLERHRPPSENVIHARDGVLDLICVRLC